jgi:hypothetical protein
MTKNQFKKMPFLRKHVNLIFLLWTRRRNVCSNYLFQIRKLHMVLFKLEMIQANNKLFYTEKKKLYN